MELDSVVEKIKKLFALANRAKNNDGSSNGAEASAAMARAQELLAKYNLSAATIQDSVAGDKVAEAAVGPRAKQQVKHSAQYRWQQEFWRALAEANYCVHWVTTVLEEHKSSRTGRDYRHAKRHVILGSEVNVAVVVMMGEYLTEVIERELPYPQNERLSKAAISWREGCASRLIERITEKMTAMKAEGFKGEDGAQVTALAVQSVEDRERAANYDAQCGPGAWARKLKRDAEWEARWAAEAPKREAEALVRQSKEEAARAAETPAQRRKREEQEQRAQDRAWRTYQRQEEREANRLDITAYSSGRRTANKVNLDKQVKS